MSLFVIRFKIFQYRLCVKFPGQKVRQGKKSNTILSKYHRLYANTAAVCVGVTDSPMSKCSQNVRLHDETSNPAYLCIYCFPQHLLLHTNITTHLLMKHRTSFTEIAPHCSYCPSVPLYPPCNYLALLIAPI